MAEAATKATEKRERKRQPTIRVTEDVAKKLDQLSGKTAEQLRAAGVPAVTLTHSQLVESLVDLALENGNEAGS